MGLFKDARSFEDIQNQIQNHSEVEKSQGDAFEVFAEAYLKLGFHIQYQKVHPENDIPYLIAKKYKIPKRKVNLPGMDGVVIDLADQVFTYQVKFTTITNYKLPWGKLAGSIAISTKTKGALIFTNAVSIHDDIKNHGGFAITKSDLNQLTLEDLKRIEALVYKGKYEKRDLFTSVLSKNAFNDVIDAFKSKDRAQLIMACGTGKTLVGQRLIEEINGKNHIGFSSIPSIA